MSNWRWAWEDFDNRPDEDRGTDSGIDLRGGGRYDDNGNDLDWYRKDSEGNIVRPRGDYDGEDDSEGGSLWGGLGGDDGDGGSGGLFGGGGHGSADKGYMGMGSGGDDWGWTGLGNTPTLPMNNRHGHGPSHNPVADRSHVTGTNDLLPNKGKAQGMLGKDRYDATSTGTSPSDTTDLPANTGPGKYSRQNIRSKAMQKKEVQDAMMQGRQVMLVRNITVGGKRVQGIETLSRGINPDNPMYVTFSGDFNTDGSQARGKQAKMESSDECDCSTGGSGGGGSAGSSGGGAASGAGGGGGAGGTGGGPSGGSGGGSAAGTDGSGSGDKTDNSTAGKDGSKPPAKRNIDDTTQVTERFPVINRYYEAEFLNYAYDPLTPEQRKAEQVYKKNHGDEIKKQGRAIDPAANVKIRFRFQNEAGSDGRPTYTDDIVPLGDDNGSGNDLIYDVIITGLDKNTGIMGLGSGTQGGWSDYHEPEDIAPIEPAPLRQLPVPYPAPECLRQLPVPPLPPVKIHDDDHHPPIVTGKLPDPVAIEGAGFSVVSDKISQELVELLNKIHHDWKSSKKISSIDLTVDIGSNVMTQADVINDSGYVQIDKKSKRESTYAKGEKTVVKFKNSKTHIENISGQIDEIVAILKKLFKNVKVNLTVNRNVNGIKGITLKFVPKK